MKTEKNIFIAFVLNLSFSIFEFVGGMTTGSIAIVSDAIHDIGDAASIGIAYFLEKKSKRQPDETYTYGYGRYSVMGGFITTVILLVGSVIMLYNAIDRILNPVEINYNGMLIFAVVGVCVNFCAAFFTRDGDSINQKAVNLHMLEDVLGWIVVLIGAIVMKFTDFVLIDSIMSMGVSVFILVNVIKNLKEVADLFLEKAPPAIAVGDIKAHIMEIDGVLDVHHVHLWSMDGHNHYATMHVVTNCEMHGIKNKIREDLQAHGIGHVTIEMETEFEQCCHKMCKTEVCSHAGYSHHHHGYHS